MNNQIPDWNNLVYRDQWRTASENLHTTNNFPEFTGRVCPAPCEASCTLNIIDSPVTIKTIECQIVDRAWEEGWIQPQVAAKKTGKTVAVVGSGPAGMACAQQLARAGHSVTLFEKNDRIGGLLRYGIPDFKMEKHLIDRRVRQMQAEGVVFRAGVEIGAGVPVQQLMADYDAVVLSGGAEAAARPADRGPRPGRHPFRHGFPHPAEQAGGRRFRKQGGAQWHAERQGQACGSDRRRAIPVPTVSAPPHRHGAASVTQFEIMPQPPAKENKLLVWPDWPLKLRTSSSHQEGCERDW